MKLKRKIYLDAGIAIMLFCFFVAVMVLLPDSIPVSRLWQ